MASKSIHSTKTQISVKFSTRKMLKVAAAKNGISMVSLVDKLVRTELERVELANSSELGLQAQSIH